MKERKNRKAQLGTDLAWGCMGISGHGLWYGLDFQKSKNPPHSYIWAARKGDILYFCPRYKLVNAHNIPHFSTEQLYVACLKRTGNYMYM